MGECRLSYKETTMVFGGVAQAIVKKGNTSATFWICLVTYFAYFSLLLHRKRIYLISRSSV